MKAREHHYQVSIEWIGNKGTGTSSYKAYARDYVISADSKSDIQGSSDPAFLGDATRWNPEDLLVASASACHKLWYLHLCAEAGIIVEAYVDHAEGTMVEGEKGRFTRIVLKPEVTVKPETNIELATDLHHKAHELCYVANSLNFPVHCEPTFKIYAGLR
ncbi:OsmC family protein [Rouxiella sp. WC2420]|uniref:OsmC family protein n=1 Tax=Rouxiella sp. WC2420 TaxID=3234145 RepID=A0AB39VVP6_9GAMM